MSTQVKDLPIVTGGIGAAVDTSEIEAQKTIIAVGVTGNVTVEARSAGGPWCTAASFKAQKDCVVTLSCSEMRLNATGGDATSVQVLAEGAIIRSADIPTPPKNGAAGSVNVTAFGHQTTVFCSDIDGKGVVEIQISGDDINWETVWTFKKQDPACQTRSISAKYIRAKGNGATGTCAISSQDDAADDASVGLSGAHIVWRPGGVGSADPGEPVYTELSPKNAYDAAVALTPYGPVRFCIDNNFGEARIPNDGNVYNFASPNIIVTGLNNNSNGTCEMVWSEGSQGDLFQVESLGDFGRFRIFTDALVGDSPIPIGFGGITVLGNGEVHFSGRVAGAIPIIKVTNPFGNFCQIKSVGGGRIILGENGAGDSEAPVLDINGGFCRLNALNFSWTNNCFTDSDSPNGFIVAQLRGTKQNQSTIVQGQGFIYPALASGQFFAQNIPFSDYRFDGVYDSDFDFFDYEEQAIIDTDGGDVTGTLPVVGDGGLYRCLAKNIGTSGNLAVVEAPVGYTVEGQASISLQDGEAVEVIFDGGTNFICVLNKTVSHGDSSKLVWRHDATGANAPGGNVYTDWESLYIAIQARRTFAKIIIEIDSRFSMHMNAEGLPACPMPSSVGEPGGKWDLSNCEISTYGTRHLSAASGNDYHNLDLLADCKITGLYAFTNNCSLQVSHDTPDGPVIELDYFLPGNAAGFGIGGNGIVWLGNTTPGSGPIVKIADGTVLGFIAWGENNGGIGNRTQAPLGAPVVDIGAAFVGAIFAGVSYRIFAGGVSSSGGAPLIISRSGPGAAIDALRPADFPGLFVIYDANMEPNWRVGAPETASIDIGGFNSAGNAIWHFVGAGPYQFGLPDYNNKWGTATRIDNQSAGAVVAAAPSGQTIAGVAQTGASGVLTLAANLADGDTVTVGTKTYTAQAVLTDVDGNFLIGASASDTIDNLIAAINLDPAGAGTLYAASMTSNDALVTASAGAGDTMDVDAQIEGTGGNAIATTEVSATASWGAATLTGGTGGYSVAAGAAAEFVAQGFGNFHKFDM